jgi:hypothetical protein
MNTGRTSIWMHVARWMSYRIVRIAGSWCVWGYNRPSGLSSAGADSLTLSGLSKPRGAGLTLGGATGAGIGTAILGPVGGYVGDPVAIGECQKPGATCLLACLGLIGLAEA